MSLDATIKISSETRAVLNALKRGGETQDDVIRRLIYYHAKPAFDKITEILQRPDPSIDTLGFFWATRSDDGKQRLWQCMKNAKGDYEWVQLAVST